MSGVDEARLDSEHFEKTQWSKQARVPDSSSSAAAAF